MDGLMVIERACVTTCSGTPESLTWTVNDDVPAAVGVPEITPVVLSRPRPCGGWFGPTIIQARGPVPPVACTVWL